MIELGIDETEALRILITPGSTGDGSIELSFESSETPGSQHSVELDVARDPNRSTESGVTTTIAIVLLLAFIVAGLIFAGLLIMRLRDGNPSPAVAMNAPPAAAFNTAQSIVWNRLLGLQPTHFGNQTCLSRLWCPLPPCGFWLRVHRRWPFVAIVRPMYPPLLRR